MSLFGSLFSGVSGLNAQSRAMGMISDNVANVNTTAYKGAQAQFANLVTRSRGSYDLQPRRRPRAELLHGGEPGPDPEQLLANRRRDLGRRLLRRQRARPTAGRAALHPCRLVQSRLPGRPAHALRLLSAGLGAGRRTRRSSTSTALETVNVRSINGLAAATTTVRGRRQSRRRPGGLCRRLRGRRPRRLPGLGRRSGVQPTLHPRGAGLRQPRPGARPDPGLPAQRGRQQLGGRDLRRHRRTSIPGIHPERPAGLRHA